jgi:hypothetical protein
VTIHASVSHRGLTTGERVIDLAARDSLELEERAWLDAWVWGWRRGEGRRWPRYLEELQTLGWMRDRLRRARVFA